MDFLYVPVRVEENSHRSAMMYVIATKYAVLRQTISRLAENRGAARYTNT